MRRQTSLWRRLKQSQGVRVMLGAIAAVLLCGSTAADPVALTWDTVDDARVTGYELGWGAAPNAYTAFVPSPDTSKVLDLVVPGPWHIAVRALGDDPAITSAWSNEIVWQLADTTPLSQTGLWAQATGSQVVAASVISSLSIAWASGSDPAAQNVDVPANTTHAILFWSFITYTTDAGVSTATLNGNSYNTLVQATAPGGEQSAIGAVVFNAPASGTVSLDVAWSASNYGRTAILVFVTAGGSIRDSDAASSVSTAINLTVDSSADDLVLAFASRYSSPQSTISGWTSIATETATSLQGRAQYILGSDATQGASITPYYGGLVTLSVAPVTAAATSPPFAIQRFAHMLVR